MSFFPISAKELEGYMRMNGTILVDLREKEDYQKGHIKMAVNIPFEEFEQYKDYLSQFEVIIFYCERGNSSFLISREYENSHQNVFTLVGGYNGNKGKILIDGRM